MKRRSSSFSIKSQQYKWRRNLFALLLIGLCCFFTLLVFEAQYTRIKLFASFYHSQSPPLPHYPKIAFLFIARNRLPLDIVWDAFFQVLSKCIYNYDVCCSFYSRCFVVLSMCLLQCGI